MVRKPPPRALFPCVHGEEGVVAPPVPAKRHVLATERCMPFLDVKNTGWIVPLPAIVRLKASNGGRDVEAGRDCDRTLVRFHGADRVRANPKKPRVACKFHNVWTILAPPGWSCRPQADLLDLC